MKGKDFSNLIVETLEPFLQHLKKEQRSLDYLTSSRRIIKQFAMFCVAEQDDNPWQMRAHYLESRAQLRQQQFYSHSFLENHGRELKRFLTWIKKGNRADLTNQSAEQVLEAYWGDHQSSALPYKKVQLKQHVPAMMFLVKLLLKAQGKLHLDDMLDTHFELRHLYLRSDGFGYVLSNRTKVVTRNLLCWLEKHGQLSSGTAQRWIKNVTTTREAEYITSQLAANYFSAKIDSSLPPGLLNPLLEYMTHLTEEKMLAKKTIQRVFLSNFRLCHYLLQLQMINFASFQIKHAESFIQAQQTSFLSKDLRFRRQYLRELQSRLRGFFYFLFTKGYLPQDISTGLIAPPCYRYPHPQKRLSRQALQHLLESIDRSTARGRRTYAIVILSVTYGLRASDMARLKLDDIEWKARRIRIVQNKTGVALSLPLLAEVAQAIYDYLSQDRPRDQFHRQVFLSLRAPYHPVQACTLSDVITSAMQAAQLSPCGVQALRRTVATHLLEQGEGISSIQEILGHRSAETTQRYMRTSLKMMQEIFDEDER